MEILILSLILTLLIVVYIFRDLTWDKLKRNKKQEKPLKIDSKRRTHGSPRRNK